MKKMKKNRMKQFITLFLACMLLVSVSVSGDTLTAQAAQIETINLDKKNLTVSAGESKRLSAKTSPAGGKVVWSSSNDKIAVVKNGTITGVSVGTATITARSGGKKASCKVRVTLGTKAKQAIKAYQKYLRQPRIKWTKNTSYGREQFRFVLADLNGDGVPELMLRNYGGAAHFEGYQAVYCYQNGKVKELIKDDAVMRYYPQKGIFVTAYYGSDSIETYYKITKKGNVSEIGSAPQSDLVSDTPFKWRKKKVTRKEFKRLVKKEAGKNPVGFNSRDWKKNTSANRQKMEKLIKK